MARFPSHREPPGQGRPWQPPVDLGAIIAAVQSALNAQQEDPLGWRGDSVQRVAVPAYFYPAWYTAGSDTVRLIAQTPTVDLMILDPLNGPDTTVNTDYATTLRRAQAAGMRVLGYVDTNYRAVSLSKVKQDIDGWYALYPSIQGIFVDQTEYQESLMPYYTEVSKYIRARGGIVIMNPGTAFVEESYLTISDILMNFENTGLVYSTAVFPDYIHNYPTWRFWHCIHDVATTGARDSTLALTKTNRAGYVYITTQPSYNSLPTDPFWSGLVAAVK